MKGYGTTKPHYSFVKASCDFISEPAGGGGGVYPNLRALTGITL